MFNDFDYFFELDNIFHAPISLTTDNLPQFDFDAESFFERKRKSSFNDDDFFYIDGDLFDADSSFGDLSFGDDSGFSKSRKEISYDEPEPLPEQVEDYIIYATIEHFKAKKSLERLAQYRRTLYSFDRRAHAIVKKLVKKWLSVGDYESALIGTIYMMKNDENLATDVIDYTIEHDTISLLIQAIQNHRAKQGGAIIYTMLFLTLLTKQDKRAYDVYARLLDHLNNIHHSAGKGIMLMLVTSVMGLVGLPPEEKQLAEQFLALIRQDDDKEDEFIIALRFIQTLFDKSHLDQLYAVSRRYWDGIQSSPHQQSFELGLMGDIGNMISSIDRITAFLPAFQLRHYDFISPWIATFYYFDNIRGGIESFVNLQVSVAYFIKQSDPIKRILFIKGDDIEPYAQNMFGIMTAMLNLLATNPPQGFYELPKRLWDDIEDDTDKWSWIMSQAILTSLRDGKPVDIQPLLDEILTLKDVLDSLIWVASILILDNHPQINTIIQHIAEHLSALIRDILQKNSFSARTIVLRSLKKELGWRFQYVFNNMILVWLGLGNHADVIQFVKQLPSSLAVILLSPELLDYYDEKPDDWDDSYWTHYATLQQTYLDTLKKVILAIAPTLSQTELSYLSSEVDGTPFTDLSDALKTIIPVPDSPPLGIVTDNFEPLPINSLASELQVQRKEFSEQAYDFAKKHIPQAKNNFDEAVRLARIVQTQAIPKPLEDITQQLVYTIILKTDDVASILAEFQQMPTYYQRHRDKMAYSVVCALVDTQRFNDATALCEMMITDPWRIQAHAKLIEALVVAGKQEDADTWVVRAEGKYNRFMVACADALGMLKIGHDDADNHHQMVQNAIQALPRPTLQASASRHYAFGLLKIGHAYADSTLQQALDFTLATSDMLSRFYGLYDILEVLLAHQHRSSKIVLGHILTVLDEGKNISLPELPDLGYPPQYQQQVAEQAQSLWRWVGLNSPIWDTMANLDVARLLFKYQHTDEAQKLIQQVQAYQAEMRLPWDVSLEFAKIAQPSQLKLTFENLGVLPLNQVLEIILAWHNLFNQLEHNLADKIIAHMFRLFSWIGYEVGDLNYLISIKRPTFSDND